MGKFSGSIRKPGCFTQGKNFEEARQNLIDAIELWVTIGLKKGEEMPIVNGHRSAANLKEYKKKNMYV